MPENRVTRQANAIIRNNKGKETDQPRKGERTTRRDQQPSKRGNRHPTYATDGTPQPGAETRRAGTGKTASGSYLYRGEPHARTAWERGETAPRPPQTAKQCPTNSPPARQATNKPATSHNQPTSSRASRDTLSSLSLSLLSKHEKLASAAPKKQQKHRHQGRNGSAACKRPKYKMDNRPKVCRSGADDRPM